ncbi:chymotrypsinogen A-like isoform X2 [Tubulanus polymorphus]|uniref:chymotrypsinogen A-like isoform X2 n=1 Tax=Tubulanus polymorphus TaxID=672921 RepID=UPI003DA3E63B
MCVIFTGLFAFCCILAAPVASAVDDGDWRIIGGNEIASEGIYPWLVSIRGKFTTTSVIGIPLVQRIWTCGASVIIDRWVLTAAHCFDNDKYDIKNPKGWTVRLASTKLSAGVIGTIKGWLGKVFKKDKWVNWDMDVEKIIIHPQYNRRRSWENDIALMKLKRSVPVGPEFANIARITLPDSSPSFPAPGQSCLMTGWGCTAAGKSVTSKAMEVRLPILSDSACYRMWHVDTDKRLCAGQYNMNVGGDSGGPLACLRGSQWVQVGIASFTIANDPGSRPGAFTRVSHYVNWIKSTMSSN